MSEILFAINWVHRKLKNKIQEIDDFINQVDEWEKERKIEVIKMAKNKEYEKLCKQLKEKEITFEEVEKKAKRISVLYG